MDEELTIDEVSPGGLFLHDYDPESKLDLPITIRAELRPDVSPEQPEPIALHRAEPIGEDEAVISQTKEPHIVMVVPAGYKLDPIWGMVSAETRARALKSAAMLLSLGLAAGEGLPRDPSGDQEVAHDPPPERSMPRKKSAPAGDGTSPPFPKPQPAVEPKKIVPAEFTDAAFDAIFD